MLRAKCFNAWIRARLYKLSFKRSRRFFPRSSALLFHERTRRRKGEARRRIAARREGTSRRGETAERNEGGSWPVGRGNPYRRIAGQRVAPVLE